MRADCADVPGTRIRFTRRAHLPATRRNRCPDFRQALDDRNPAATRRNALERIVAALNRAAETLRKARDLAGVGPVCRFFTRLQRAGACLRCSCFRYSSNKETVMRKRFVGTSLVAALVLLVASSALIAQRRPGRPAPAAAPAAPARSDLKIAYRQTFGTDDGNNHDAQRSARALGNEAGLWSRHN